MKRVLELLKLKSFLNITYEYNIKQSMQMVELNLNKIIDKNPQLNSSLDSSAIHPLI